MEALLTGKTALITGATSGIGRSSAILFAKEGAQVVVTGRRENRLKELVDEIAAFGGTAAYIAGDCEDVSFVEPLLQYVLNTFGKLDILLCSAGIALRTPTLEMTAAEWEKVMTVNLTFPTMLSTGCVRHFIENGGGKIVLISSTAGKNINLGASPSYGASKAGMLYLARHLAAEFGGKGVYANAICPGPVDTEITQTWTPEHRAKVLAALPMGRMGTPEDIASCALFLASSMSDYINGEAILANGGRYFG